VQEYTLIKMEALALPGKLSGLGKHGKVFFMAATLRPETMYGQTNCWVLPEGDYGSFAAPSKQVYIMCVGFPLCTAAFGAYVSFLLIFQPLRFPCCCFKPKLK
jgi:hypothetical protein